MCGAVRDDEAISVHCASERLGGPEGALWTVHVRYCNDRPECEGVAPVVAAAWLAEVEPPAPG